MSRIALVLILFVALVLPSYSFAQGNGINNCNISAGMQNKIESREAKLTGIQERFQNRIENKTLLKETKLSQLKQDIIKKYYTQMSKRLLATIARLEKLISRIETRIVYVSAQPGNDLTTVNSELAKAKKLLLDTKALLTSTDAGIDSVIASGSPKESFAVVRSSVSDIKGNLKEVHSILVHVIGDLEGLRVGTTKLSPTVKPAASP